MRCKAGPCLIWDKIGQAYKWSASVIMLIFMNNPDEDVFHFITADLHIE